MSVAKNQPAWICVNFHDHRVHGTTVKANTKSEARAAIKKKCRLETRLPVKTVVVRVGKKESAQ